LKLKAIVIDMDGTITKFNLDYMSARRLALEELEKMNLRTVEMTEQLSLYLILQNLKDKLNADTFAIVRSKFYNLLEEMEMKAAQEVILYPGAVETLQELRRRSLKIGIVTNNGRAGTNLTLKRYGLEGYFDAVVTRDDCEEMKPSAAPVRMALKEMHVPPEGAIFVGDGIMDIMAAREAGLPSVAVATGPFTKERLLQAEPDYVLNSVNDLPLLIESLEVSAK
jgi:HAD superfamily hydrolase (TIGR01509 family)